MWICTQDSFGPLAQLVEQLTLNQRVRSSNLRRPIGNARVAELADALDLGSSPLNRGWGFKSPLSHCYRIQLDLPRVIVT